jgi:hypothetical protein
MTIFSMLFEIIEIQTKSMYFITSKNDSLIIHVNVLFSSTHLKTIMSEIWSMENG